MADILEQKIKSFKDKCQCASSEDDIKVVCAVFMSDVATSYGITLDSGSEIPSLHGGRTDSIYNEVYFEFKKYKLFDRPGNAGINEALYGRDASDHGLYHYLINYALDGCHKDQERFEYLLYRKVGVGFDGNKFVFCRFKKSSAPITIYDATRTKRFPKTI